MKTILLARNTPLHKTVWCGSVRRGAEPVERSRVRDATKKTHSTDIETHVNTYAVRLNSVNACTCFVILWLTKWRYNTRPGQYVDFIWIMFVKYITYNVFWQKRKRKERMLVPLFSMLGGRIMQIMLFFCSFWLTSFTFPTPYPLFRIKNHTTSKTNMRPIVAIARYNVIYG